MERGSREGCLTVPYGSAFFHSPTLHSSPFRFPAHGGSARRGRALRDLARGTPARSRQHRRARPRRAEPPWAGGKRAMTIAFLGTRCPASLPTRHERSGADRVRHGAAVPYETWREYARPPTVGHDRVVPNPRGRGETRNENGVPRHPLPREPLNPPRTLRRRQGSARRGRALRDLARVHLPAHVGDVTFASPGLRRGSRGCRGYWVIGLCRP